MLKTTEGIVLTTLRFSDADLIVTYLTLDRGIIKAFAKSSRKTKSRFGSSLEPLTHAIISLLGKEQSMPRITRSDILRSFQGIRERFHDFIHVSRLIEIVISLTPEGHPNRRLFLFFLNLLDVLETPVHVQKDSLYLISQIRLLKKLGYAPRLKGCGKCSAKSLYFYPGSGTTLCRQCAASLPGEKESPVKITSKTIHFYSHCLGWPVRIAAERLKPSRDTMTELTSVLDMHVTYLLNKQLHSSDFLARV